MMKKVEISYQSAGYTTRICLTIQIHP